MQVAGSVGGALVERDSDSDEELEPYDEDADRWDEEDEVSPEDERVLAAFMVRAFAGPRFTVMNAVEGGSPARARKIIASRNRC